MLVAAVLEETLPVDMSLNRLQDSKRPLSFAFLLPGLAVCSIDGRPIIRGYAGRLQLLFDIHIKKQDVDIGEVDVDSLFPHWNVQY